MNQTIAVGSNEAIPSQREALMDYQTAENQVIQLQNQVNQSITSLADELKTNPRASESASNQTDV